MNEAFMGGGAYDIPAANYNKSRNVWRTGYPSRNFWDWLNKFFALSIVPVEAIFRYRIGRRWFTFVNFLGGLFALLVVTGAEWLVSWVCETEAFQRFFGFCNSSLFNHHFVSTLHYGARTMPWFMGIYLLRSAWQFFRSFWNTRYYKAPHSFSDGRSFFEPAGRVLMTVINFLAHPLMVIFMLFLPPNERRSRKTPRLLNSAYAVTDIVIEPLVLLALAYFVHGLVTEVWLFISALVTFSNATRKIAIMRNRKDDFDDAFKEGQDVREYHYTREANAERAGQQWPDEEFAAKRKRKPKIDEEVIEDIPYEDLSDIFNKFKQSQTKQN